MRKSSHFDFFLSFSGGSLKWFVFIAFKDILPCFLVLYPVYGLQAAVALCGT